MNRFNNSLEDEGDAPSSLISYLKNIAYHFRFRRKGKRKRTFLDKAQVQEFIDFLEKISDIKAKI